MSPSQSAPSSASTRTYDFLQRPGALAPPVQFEPGTILTLRMRGHSRSPVPGSEYFAPAVVLEQFMPNGEISVLIWDSSAGTHYNASYAIRDLSTRGSGNERETYEVQSNIGQVLFSPREFGRMGEELEHIVGAIQSVRRAQAEVNNSLPAMELRIDARLRLFESFMNEFKSAKDAGAAPPDTTQTGAARDATRDESAGAAKAAPPKKP